MPDRDRLEAHEREEPGGLRPTLDQARIGPDRVGPIEHDDPHPRAHARARREERGPDEGVVARPDVLQIDDEAVDAREVLAARREVLEAIAVEAAHGDVVVSQGVGDADHVLRFAAMSVLRAEEDRRPHAEPRRGRGSRARGPG